MSLQPKYNPFLWPFSGQYELILEMAFDKLTYSPFFRVIAQVVLINTWAMPLFLLAAVLFFFGPVPLLSVGPLLGFVACYTFCIATLSLIFPKTRR